MSDIIYRLNDNVLELSGLKDAVIGTFLNAATVTVTLKDQDGVNVPSTGSPSITYPITMDYVASSDGIYRATIQDSLDVNPNDTVIAEVTANAGANLKGHWKTRLKVKDRETT